MHPRVCCRRSALLRAPGVCAPYVFVCIFFMSMCMDIPALAPRGGCLLAPLRQAMGAIECASPLVAHPPNFWSFIQLIVGNAQC